MSHTLVRVEGADSIGRTYTDNSKSTGNIKRGLGSERRRLRTRSFNPDGPLVLESAPLSLVHLANSSRDDVLEYFHNTWALTDTLFSALRDDSVFYSMPDKLRRPLIFYFCHPAALYVNKMHQSGLIDHVHPFFEKLFETGVDEMSWDDMDAMQDEDFAWPDVSEAVAYRARVKAAVEGLIRGMPDPRSSPVTMNDPLWALFLAFEHERIHTETSAVLIHQLPIASVVEPPGWRTAPSRAHTPAAAPPNALVPSAPATVVLGKPRDFPSFGWDNEYGKRVVDVPAFTASRFLVTNGEFYPFVLDGGYENKAFWVSHSGDDEGWRWRTYRNATHPSFWVVSRDPAMARFVGGNSGTPYQKDDGSVDNSSAPVSAGASSGAGSSSDDDTLFRGFKYRAIFSIIDMPWDWPAEVNAHEAAAFLQWKGAREGTKYRLPTEAEHHVMRGDPSPWPEATNFNVRMDPSGQGSSSINFNLRGSFSAESSVIPGGGGKVFLTQGYENELEARDDWIRALEKQQEEGAEPTASAASTSNTATPAAHASPLTALTTSTHAAGDRAASTSSVFAGGRAGVFDVVMQPSAPGNLNWRWHSSSPVDCFAPSPNGFFDTHGNVWEWGADHFAPLPGFEIHYMYDDFSSPCFDGWHSLILGSAWSSTGDLASSFARYHFRRHFFQHCGFRYVEVPNTAVEEPFPGSATAANLWEGVVSEVAAGLTNGYGAPERMMSLPPQQSGALLGGGAASYHAAVAGVVAAAYAKYVSSVAAPPTSASSSLVPVAPPSTTSTSASSSLVPVAPPSTTSTSAAPPPTSTSLARVLHLGCGVGAGSFHLLKSGFAGVIGVDDSEPLIRHARIMQHHGQFEYEQVREGILTDSVRVQCPVDAGTRARAVFVLGDASAPLSPELLRDYGPFDAVFVDDILTARTQPLSVLQALKSFVRPGGILVIASNNDWSPQRTPRNSWCGGFKMNGEELSTLAMLKYTLKRDFVPVETRDLPRVTRQHARKFVLDVLETSVWQRMQS